MIFSSNPYRPIQTEIWRNKPQQTTATSANWALPNYTSTQATPTPVRTPTTSYQGPNYNSLAFQNYAFGGLGGGGGGYRGIQTGGGAGPVLGAGGAYHQGFLGPQGGVGVNLPGGRFNPANADPTAAGMRMSALMGIDYSQLPQSLYRLQTLGPVMPTPGASMNWSDLTSVENFGKYPVWGTLSPTSWSMAALGEQLRANQAALANYSAAPGIGLQMGGGSPQPGYWPGAYQGVGGTQTYNPYTGFYNPPVSSSGRVVAAAG